MAGQAQQPTSAPSILAQNLAPPTPPQGLAGMVPMGAPVGQMPQGMPQRAPQAPVMQASGGLASMPTVDEDYCDGGIVAFARGGRPLGSDVSAENEYQQETDDEGYSDSQGRSIDAAGNFIDDGTDAGTGSATDRFNALLAQQIAKMQGKGAKTTSPEDREALFEKFYKRETDLAGPDIYAPEIARGKEDEADRAKARRIGEANAYFTAAGKILKGRRLSEGASEALPAFGGAMNEVERADQAAKAANAKMQFALKDAQRKERTGNIRAATAAMENYRKFQQDENKAEFDRDNAIANLAAKGIAGNRATGKGAGGLKWQEQVLQSNIDYLKTTQKPKAGESPEAFDARIRKQASDIVAPLLKTSFSTSEVGPTKASTAVAPVQQRVDAKVAQDLADFKSFSPEGAAYRRALKANAPQEAARLLKEAEKNFRAVHSRTEGLTGTGEAEPGTAENPIVIK